MSILARAVVDAVYTTLEEGEKQHPENEWASLHYTEHLTHLLNHAEVLKDCPMEDFDMHLCHLICRAAMVRVTRGDVA
jgi:hypothetical protein